MAAKCEELVFELQCMPGLVGKTRRLHGRVAKLKKACKTWAAKARAKSRFADMKVAAKKDRTDRARQNIWLGLRCWKVIFMILSKSKFLKRCNHVADLCYSKLIDKYDL